MKYFKVHYLVVNGKEILAETLFVYANEKQLPHQQLKNRIKQLRIKWYPDQLHVKIVFSIPPSEIPMEEYKILLPVHG